MEKYHINITTVNMRGLFHCFNNLTHIEKFQFLGIVQFLVDFKARFWWQNVCFEARNVYICHIVYIVVVHG